jgi:hypothetical protein
MHRLDPESPAFDLVVDSAESSNPPGIKRCTLLNQIQKARLMEKASTPIPLKQQVRTRIRNLLGEFGPFVLEKIADLQIPSLIKQYLLFLAY